MTDRPQPAPCQDITEVGSSAAPPRVVMLLANEFTHDTRVYKEARSLGDWGCHVTVVAMAGPGLPGRQTIDGIEVYRLRRRGGALWRLPMALACWWCCPLLGAVMRASPGEVSSSPQEPAVEGAGAAEAAPGPRSRPAVHDRREDRRVEARATQLAARARRWLGVPIRAMRRLWRLAGRLVRAPRRLFPASFRLLAFDVQCARFARTLGADVIHCHDLNTLMAGAILKRLGGMPLVYDSHELFLERNLGDRSRAYDRAVWAPIERFCIVRCDTVISVAEGICRHLADQYGIAKPALIRNVQPYERPAARSRLLSEELGIDPGRAVVLYPGAITINRGLEAMIDSAPHLEDAVYVIMGYARNGAYLDALKRRAAERGVLNERVYFRAAVPIDEVVRYAASADLGIVPTANVCLSYYFESSNKIFHCLMAGVPVAMSDHAEKRLLVEAHGIGVLFDETDPRAIASVVNAALANRAAYDAMRRRCLAAARTLNWEREERTLRRLYADLLGPRARPVPEVCLPKMDEPAVEALVRHPAARTR